MLEKYNNEIKKTLKVICLILSIYCLLIKLYADKISKIEVFKIAIIVGILHVALNMYYPDSCEENI